MSMIARAGWIVLLVVLLGPTGAAVADEQTLRIHLISGSAEYESEPSLKQLQQTLEEEYEHISVTASWGEDAGDDLPNIAALAEADLVIIFTRRMELPEEQLRYIRQHFEAEKPAIGIRTSSHAFQDYLEMDAEIFGGDYSGHGDDEAVAVTFADGAEDHAILAGVEPWTRPGKIYHNPELGERAEPLLLGTGQESEIHEPLAWTHRYGDAGRAFYTSMGLPGDFENDDFRRMLFNAIEWTTQRELQCAANAALRQTISEEGGRDIGAARLYAVPEPVEDAPYAVSIDGEAVPMEPAGEIEPAYYVRFHMNEPLTLEVTVDRPADHALNLQPQRYREDLQEDGQSLTLSIDEPGVRVLMMESADGARHTPLIVLAEADEPWKGPPGGREIFDVSHLSGAGPDEPQTEAIQEALDACAASEEGGVVFFGAGVYHTSGLEVGSNTMVYLAPGAVVYASTQEEDYPGQFLLFRDVENSGLAGPGILDGSGQTIRGPEGDVGMTLVRFRESRNVYAEDVFLRNAAAWTFHIVGCRDVDVDNVRVTGDWGVPNTDGINPDNSQNVRIANAFIYAGDDPACVKATNRYGIDQPTRNIEIRDSVVMTLKTSLKVGTESRQDISNVLFENIDVIHSSRGIALWMRDGYAFSDIVFRDIRMDLLEFEGENMSGEPFRFCIQDRAGVGEIRDVLIENVRLSAPFRAQFTGREGGALKDVVFRNVDWTVRPAHQKRDPLPLSAGWVVDPENELSLEGNPLMVVHRAEDFTFDNVTIDWRHVQDGPWDRFAEQRESANIPLDDIEHLHLPFADN